MYRILILCLCLFSSCLTDTAALRKIERIKAKKPEMFKTATTVDTIIKVKKDTVTVPQIMLIGEQQRPTKAIDTVFVSNRDVSTTVYVNRTDTLTKYKVITVVDERTLEVMCIDTIAVTNIITTVEKPKKSLWWVWFLVGLSFSIGFAIFRK